MASHFSEGDAVQVVDREATPADEKSSIFFNHFRGLTGTLEKVYPDKRATVVVDIASMPETIRDRHQELTRAAKQRWLDGLSNEARSRLTPEEQQFQMRYTILVQMSDLEKRGTASAKKTQPKAARATEPKAAAEPTAGTEPKTRTKAEDAHVLSQKDLDAAEEEFLRSRKQG